MADHETWLRVERGAATDEETAALIAAMTLIRRAGASGRGGPESGTGALATTSGSAWARAARAGRRWSHPSTPLGPDAWRWSAVGRQ